MRRLDLVTYQEAERRAAREEGRRGLAIHALVTVLVWIVLIVVNITVASEFPWVLFPIAGMSIGLVAHWFGVTHVDEEVRRHQEAVEHRAAA
jgi:hypothetical protein